MLAGNTRWGVYLQINSLVVFIRRNLIATQNYSVGATLALLALIVD